MLMLPTLLLSLLVLQFGFALARDRDVPEGRVSVALLVLVVPTVEVDVEHDDGTGGQTRQEVPERREELISNMGVRKNKVIDLK